MHHEHRDRVPLEKTNQRALEDKLVRHRFDDGRVPLQFGHACGVQVATDAIVPRRVAVQGDPPSVLVGEADLRPVDDFVLRAPDTEQEMPDGVAPLVAGENL